MKHEGAVTSGLPSAAERPVDLDDGGQLAQLGLREPARVLGGGEQQRLLLAKLSELAVEY
ncbi:MAG TPA: hypothetical protein VK504_10605 [Vicinamibacterales bacterium]|nr:hypothetical protein [Vicinamibacterales bacterium]